MGILAINLKIFRRKFYQHNAPICQCDHHSVTTKTFLSSGSTLVETAPRKLPCRTKAIARNIKYVKKCQNIIKKVLKQFQSADKLRRLKNT